MPKPVSFASPADLLPFTEDGYPVRGRHLLTLDQVRAGFSDAEIFAGSETRRSCWEGMLTYLHLWDRFSGDFLAGVDGGDRQPMCMWLGGSFISTKRDPHNVDLVVFVDGTVLARAEEFGRRYKTRLSKLAQRDHLTREFRVTPTIVRYHYPDTPWRNMASYTQDQQEYQVRRGGMDDWWTRTRPSGVPKGEPTEDTGGWVRGYVEVTL